MTKGYDLESKIREHIREKTPIKHYNSKWYGQINEEVYTLYHYETALVEINIEESKPKLVYSSLSQSDTRGINNCLKAFSLPFKVSKNKLIFNGFSDNPKDYK